MPFRYDLTDLRLFIHVAEASNITRGARRSNMSLAAASERIREMEATLGTALLVRGRRGIQLTAAGSICCSTPGLFPNSSSRCAGSSMATPKACEATFEFW